MARFLGLARLRLKRISVQVVRILVRPVRANSMRKGGRGIGEDRARANTYCENQVRMKSGFSNAWQATISCSGSLELENLSLRDPVLETAALLKQSQAVSA